MIVSGNFRKKKRGYTLVEVLIGVDSRPKVVSSCIDVYGSAVDLVVLRDRVGDDLAVCQGLHLSLFQNGNQAAIGIDQGVGYLNEFNLFCVDDVVLDVVPSCRRVELK